MKQHPFDISPTIRTWVLAGLAFLMSLNSTNGIQPLQDPQVSPPPSSDKNTLQWKDLFEKRWQLPPSKDPVAEPPGTQTPSGDGPAPTTPPPQQVPYLPYEAGSERPIFGPPPMVPEGPSSVVGDSWWRTMTGQTILEGQPEIVDVTNLVYRALRESRQIQALSQEPLIREADINIARADFDPNLFARTLFEDKTDPVGNTLTTGGEPFLKDHVWSARAGLRQKFFTGGNLELSQRLGFQNSNSTFFLPQDQGTATLALNFNQPLLRGRGQCYNRAQIVIAQSATEASWDVLAGKLQDELLAVSVAYWDLYAKRASYLQKQRNFERGLAIQEKLEARAALDAQSIQIAQARAAVQSRRTELVNAIRDVRDAETEIRRLISDPSLHSPQNTELLTAESPLESDVQYELDQAVQIALANRPIIRQAARKVEIAAKRNDISRHELLPELTLLFGTYVSALEGDSRVLPAWSRQFYESTPGYSAGLEFAFPWQNRAAHGRERQTQLELTKSQLELEQTTVNVISEAQKAHRRVESALSTLVASKQSLAAAQAELSLNMARWESMGLVEADWSEGNTQSLFLDQLLASQQRLLTAETSVVESERELKVAQLVLRRAMGVLVEAQPLGSADSYTSSQRPQ